MLVPLHLLFIFNQHTNVRISRQYYTILLDCCVKWLMAFFDGRDIDRQLQRYVFWQKWEIEQDGFNHGLIATAARLSYRANGGQW